MHFFEVLEIAPTTDIRAIKRAYAKLSAKHHPEDDEEMFLRINRAYQMAVQYAERTAAYEERQNAAGGAAADAGNTAQTADRFEPSLLHDEAAAPPGKNAGSEKDFAFPVLDAEPWEAAAEGDPDFDFSRLQEAAREAAATAGVQDPFHDPQDEIEYNRSAQRLFEKLQAVYAEPLKRNSSGAWEEIFQSAEFQYEKDNTQFVEWVLDYLFSHREISAHIWNGIIVPVLQEWLLYYQGPSYAILQSKLKHLAVPVKAKERQGFSARRPVSVLLILLAVIGGIARFGSFGNSRSSVNVKPTPGPTFNYEMLNQNTDNSTLLLLIKGKTDYSLIKTFSNGKITEAEYDKLCALYDSEGEDALEQALSDVLDTNPASSETPETLESGS